MKTKIEALAEFLECDPSEITQCNYSHYGLDTFTYGNHDYSVADEDESDEAIEDSLRGSVWAFNSVFILEVCGLPLELAPCIKSFQSSQCENANDAIAALIYKTCGWQAFTEAAISADGRGHYLSSYDGEEHESDNYLIYKN